MPSVTTIDGYTFNNLGPLTTTFTPPASCVTGTANLQIAVTDTELDTLYLQYAQQCSTVAGLDCTPPGFKYDPKPTSSANLDPTQIFNRPFYSPGFVCPSGWSTAGVAEYSNGTVSGSGVFKPTATATHDPDGPAEFEVPGTLLMSLLDPRETAVACCPSSMTADLSNGCYSAVPDYKPSVGCFEVIPNEDLGTATKTATVNGTAQEYPIQTLIATSPMTSKVTTTFKETDMSTLVGVTYMPMVTMIYREEENSSSGSGTSATTGGSSTIGNSVTTGDSTGTSATTSNAAARGVYQSSWNELLPVLGVSAAAVALGAAIILPF